MIPTIRYASLSLLALSGLALAGPDDDFQGLVDDYWNWNMNQNPVWASTLGDRRANDQWRDNSLEAIETRYHKRRDFMARLRDIDANALTESNRLNHELLRRELQDDIDANKYRAFLMPINQRGGIQTLENVAERIPLAEAARAHELLENGRYAGKVVLVTDTL